MHLSKKHWKRNNLWLSLLYISAIIALLSYVLIHIFVLKKSSNEIVASGSQNPAVITISPPSKEDLIIGSFESRYQIVVFNDYECPYCYELEKSIPSFFQEFGTSTVSFIIRNLPLEIHANSYEFAIDVECSHKLYGNEKALDLGKLIYKNMEKSLSVVRDLYAQIFTEKELSSLKACRDLDQQADSIKKEASEALLNELGRTPSIAIYDTKNSKYIYKLSGGNPTYYKRIFREIVKAGGL